MKILVIEDSRLFRIMIERTLVRAEYDVVVTGDGQHGLQLAQGTRPDIIILDMMLPTLDGTMVLRSLKQDAGTRSIPVIVLSGLSQKNEEKLKIAGAAAYFEKSKLNLDDNGGALLQIVRQLEAELAPRAIMES